MHRLTVLLAASVLTSSILVSHVEASDPSPHRPRPGETVLVGGISFVVPAPGRGVWATAVREDGSVRTVGLVTSPGGSVREQRVAPSQHGAATPTCSDSAYTVEGTSWSNTYKWFFKASSTPSEISESSATSALRAAAGNITGADNDCGVSDKVGISYSYQGTTSSPINISSGSACLGSDGKSVVGFGNLASSDLGFTCWWTRGGTTVEADVKLNKTEFEWAVDLGGCTNEFSVEAVATHEFGHVFGLGHVGESQHGGLTMSPVISACQSSERSLGLGDVRGLESMY